MSQQSDQNGAVSSKSRHESVDSLGLTLIELLIVIVVIGILGTVVIIALKGITGNSTNASLTTVNDVCQVKPGEKSEYVIEFPTYVHMSANETKSISLVLARTENGISSPGSAHDAYPACAVIAKLYINGGPSVSLQGFPSQTLFANSYSKWTWTLDGRHRGKYLIHLLIESQLLSGKSVMITASSIPASLTVSAPTESWRGLREVLHFVWHVLWWVLLAIVGGFFSLIGAKLYRLLKRRRGKVSRKVKGLDSEVVHDTEDH